MELADPDLIKLLVEQPKKRTRGKSRDGLRSTEGVRAKARCLEEQVGQKPPVDIPRSEPQSKPSGFSPDGKKVLRPPARWRRE